MYARGVTYSYLGADLRARVPSRRSLELIAASLKLEPRYFPEYRLAELRDQLGPIRAGFCRLASLPRAWPKGRRLLVNRQQPDRLATILGARARVDPRGLKPRVPEQLGRNDQIDPAPHQRGRE